jgi:carbonic anhydrase
MMVSMVSVSGCSTPQSAQPITDEDMSDDDQTTQNAQWGYSDEVGPEYWAKLSEEYRLCDSGMNQSPIDISDTEKTELLELTFDYPSMAEVIHRTKTSVELGVPDGNSLEVEQGSYRLKQFHFHAPAEHTIEGETYPLELHLVHESADGETAVVAVLYELGEQHREIYRILNYLPPGQGESRRLDTADIDPSALLPDDLSYYRYNGSLTTPPCTEGVRWYIMKATPEVSASQIDAFKRAVGGPNARPIQPLNARVVLE